MFTIMVQDILRQPVRGLMSEVPPIVDTSANLMEAVNRMILLKVPRLLVTEQDTPVGVVREQDLFFEMVRILRQQR
jgi:predicted transcriptional regulator